MYIHDSTIKYLKQSEGLIFKSLPTGCCCCSMWITAIAVVSLPVFIEIFGLFLALLSLVVFMAVLWAYALWDGNREYIKLLEDGFELYAIKGFKTIPKKYNWKDVEKLEVIRSEKYKYLIIKERNKTKELSLVIDSLGDGKTTLKSVKPLGCGLSIEDYINYIDLISKEDSFSKFVFDKNEKIATEENACSFILNMVCKLNPAARSSQAKILAAERKRKYQLLTGFDYDDDVNGLSHAAGVLRKWERADKQRFVELLFRLVITDDGIKNDEWYFMQRLIADLGFNQHWLDFFNRRYSSLRTEFDYKYNEQSSPSSSSFASSLQPYYNLLGLPADASISQLQAAYHQLAMENHPDLPKNANRTAECEKTMTKINEAYEVLARSLNR